MPVQTMPTSASSSEPPSQDFQYTVPSQQAPSASITIDIHVSNNTTITSKFRDTSHYEAALRKPNPVANPYATNQVPSSTSQPTVQPNPYQVNANPYVNPAVAPVNTFQNSNPYSVYGAKATNTVPQSQHSTTVPTANSSNNYIANNPYNNPISNPYQKIAQPIQQVVPSHPYNTNLHAAVPSSTNVSTSSNHYAPLAQQHSSNFNPNMVTHPEQSYQYHASTRPPAATNPYTIPQTNQVPTSMGPTTTTSTGTELTPEMLRKIEENRLKALARKAAKSQPSLPLTSNSHETSSAAHSYSSGYNYHASSSVHTNNYPRSPNQHLSHPYGKPQALPSQPPPQQGQTPYGIQQQYATHPTNSNTLPFNTARGNNLQVSDSALQHGYNMFPTGNPPPAPNQN